MCIVLKQTSIIFFLLFFIVACGGGSGGTSTTVALSSSVDESTEVQGAGVKGPLAGAGVAAYQVDLSASNLKGSLLGSGTTGSNAAITGLSIPSDSSGQILLEFNVNGSTIDITSGVAPDFDRLTTVINASRILAGDSIYASILTTMAVELAAANADIGIPYSGNGDGNVSQQEFDTALDVAQLQLKSMLGFGMSTDIDIYSVPPLLTNEIDTDREQADVVAYRQANEVVAALVIQASEASSAEDTAQEILEALVLDIGDGDIDGSGLNGVVSELEVLDEDIDITISSADLASLEVPGTDILIRDIEQVVADETETTGSTVDTSNLEDGTLDVEIEDAELVSDIDGDGIIDIEDSTPTGMVDSGNSSGQDGDDSSGQDGGGSNDGTDGSDSSGGSAIVIGITDPEEVEATIDSGLNYSHRSAGEDVEATNSSSFVFRYAGDQTLEEGAQLANPANTLAGGRIDYTSSNNGIASVDINGLVSSWRAGTTTITATSNRGFYLSYELTVTASQIIRFNSWVGSANSEVWVTQAVDDLSVYRSSDPGCDVTNVSGCANGAVNSASEALILDSASSTNLNAFYHFENSAASAQAEVGTGRWSDREEPALAVFKDRMWLTGGGDIGSPISKSDVWSTRDGGTWVEVTADSGFAGRRNHAVAAFDNKLWVVAGEGDSGRLNDVWSSEDGVSWTQVTESAAFSAREGHSLVVYDEKLWLIAGDGHNDVWNTVDGITWVQITDGSGSFPASGFNDAFLFDGQLMIVMSTEVSSRVWTSIDGASWTPRENARPPSTTWGSYAVHDDKIWAMGGAYSGFQDRVWVSFDGNDYYAVPQVEDKEFRARYKAASISYKNRLWLMAGDTSVGSVNDVLSSTDGAGWTRHNLGSPSEGRLLQAMAAHNGRLYILGGVTPTGQNSVWSTEDGVAWDQAASDAGFGERVNHQAFSFNNTLWVVGGDTFYTGAPFSDIWSSEDGETWTEESSNAAFGARTSMRIIEWNDELWMSGGEDENDVHYADVWRSLDGVNWTLVTSDAGFTERRGHGFAVMNNQLWVFGGLSSTHFGLNDVWVSSDGENWTQQTVSSPFSAGFANKSIGYNGMLILLTDSEELWSSTNGASWTSQGADIGLPANAYGSSMCVLGDYLWLRASGWSRFRGNFDNATYRSNDGINWRIGLGPILVN